MISKSGSDIRNDMLTELAARLPNLDTTSGTPERDLFVEAPIAGQLSPTWEQIIYTAKLHAPHVYYNDLNETDLTNYMQNYNVTPKGATYTTGVVTFYTNNAPTQDISIPSGTVVRTQEATPIEFIVQGTYSMYSSIASFYYNATTKRYEINCSVKAALAGPNSRAGSNTITSIAGSISGISGVTNSSPVTGGQDAETIEQALARVIQQFQGRTLGPTQGLVNYISSYVDALNVVGASDPEMQRDEGLGGAIDLYVIGENLVSVTDTIPITSTGLNTGINVPYTKSTLTLLYQPVDEVVVLLINGIVINPLDYTLHKDTGLLAKSTRGFDKILLSSTGIITSTGTSTGVFFKAGDTVEATYIYNALLKTIEDDLNSTANYYQNRDYLLREMAKVTIDVYMQFKETAGQDFTIVAADVELTIATAINSVKNGGSLEVADIVGVVKAISTVDNINLTNINLTPIGGGTKTAQGDILFGKREYPVSGAITLVRWTS